MNQEPFVLGVDLDGVVADFYDGMRKIAAEWLGVEEDSLERNVTYGLSEWHLERMGGSPVEAYERLHRFAVTERDLFRVLKPMYGAPAALRRLSTLGGDKLRIRVITNRLYIKYFHKEAAYQTVDWLEYHGVPYWDLCLIKDKTAVGADLYIEDSSDNIVALRQAGHAVIVFDNSTNRDVDDPRAIGWTDLEEQLKRRFDDWKVNNGRPIGEPRRSPSAAPPSASGNTRAA